MYSPTGDLGTERPLWAVSTQATYHTLLRRTIHPVFVGAHPLMSPPSKVECTPVTPVDFDRKLNIVGVDRPDRPACAEYMDLTHLID